MKLSVIVPVYNMAADGKLQFCLDSILKQTMYDLEIIAVDDASTDDSYQVLLSYADRYPEKVKVFRNSENKRQGGAKNEGLKHASGEWIGFVDSDDFLDSRYYEKLLQKAEETGADVVGTDYTLVSKQEFMPGKTVANNSLQQCGVLDEAKHKDLVMRPGSMVIKIYRRELIYDNHLDFPEHIFYEDNCAGTVWMLYAKHFEKVEEPLYYYYQHDTSTVHTITEERCRDRMKAGELLLLETKARGFYDTYREEIEFRFIETYYVTTVFSYLSGAKKIRLSFLNELRMGAKAYVPNFEENPYYVNQIGPEERKLLHIQQKNNTCFLLYYLGLKWYRKLRYRK